MARTDWMEAAYELRAAELWLLLDLVRGVIDHDAFVCGLVELDWPPEQASELADLIAAGPPLEVNR